MANILLLDDNDVAGRAFQGIVARGQHRCLVIKTPEEAWRLLREGVVIDVIFLEVKTGNGAGLTLLQRLRADWFWSILPVVVYTSEADSKIVRRVLGLKVQNYLIKPYIEQSIHNEIGKALQNPWRELHFEEAKSYCTLMGMTPQALADMRREVMVGFDEAVLSFPKWADARQNDAAFGQMNDLIARAEAAGVWGGLDYVRELKEKAALGDWNVFINCAEPLAFAGRLIFCHLNPSFVPDCLCTEAEAIQVREAVERARWESLDIESSGPQTERATLEAEMKALGGCPVIDLAAASFQMVADGSAARMAQIMDLVAEDPGLAVQVLMAANKGAQDEMTAIDDVRTAASMLGDVKLSALAKSFPVALARHAEVAPFSWAGYWTFQVAVGRVTQFICTYLEFDYMKGTAGVAGLIHDIGRLFLLKLQPHGFGGAVRYAREKKVPLAVAERKHFGCSGPELAAVFAQTAGLPRAYTNVLRWVDAPAEAEADSDLVAMVALARHICGHAHVGTSGDFFPGHPVSFTSTAAWQMLQSRLFPSFDARRLELQAHAYCLTLKAELSGQRADHRPTHAQRAAELV